MAGIYVHFAQALALLVASHKMFMAGNFLFHGWVVMHGVLGVGIPRNVLACHYPGWNRSTSGIDEENAASFLVRLCCGGIRHCMHGSLWKTINDRQTSWYWVWVLRGTRHQLWMVAEWVTVWMRVLYISGVCWTVTWPVQSQGAARWLVKLNSCHRFDCSEGMRVQQMPHAAYFIYKLKWPIWSTHYCSYIQYWYRQSNFNLVKEKN